MVIVNWKKCNIGFLICEVVSTSVNNSNIVLLKLKKQEVYIT